MTGMSDLPTVAMPTYPSPLTLRTSYIRYLTALSDREAGQLGSESWKGDVLTLKDTNVRSGL
jgi:hypothetical protein